MNILRLYKKTENKEHREWFLLTLFLLLGLLALICLTFFYENGTSEYYRANSGLFVISVMVFLIFIGSRQKTKNIFSDLKRLFTNNDELKLTNYGDIILLVIYVTAMFSFIFVLDLSFIENSGIRISAVVSVTIIKLLIAIKL